MNYVLMTDSCCDLPYRYLRERNIEFVNTIVNLDGKEYIDDLRENFDYDFFLEQLKNGKMPKTSQVNIGIYLKVFEPYIEKKIPLLYLAFSSGLSGSYNNAVAAVNVLKEKYQEQAFITIVDTKAACLGEGLLVINAADLRDKGKTLSEVVIWLEEYKMRLQSWVTVDDLEHLERGGRISKTAARVGSLVNIKPIIHVNGEGKLIPVSKVRGRKKSIQRIVKETVKEINDPKDQQILIAYVGEIEDAKKIKNDLNDQIEVQKIEIMPMGPTIASHTGYGALAIFSFGNKRN